MKKYKLALHIFRRDLRLSDNTALIYALEHAEQVIPCFIFDPRQTVSNPYKSNNALQFMIESLENLDLQLRKRQGKLYLLEGVAEHVITHLIHDNDIDLVTINKDYTPFSIQRDKKIQDACKKNAIQFSSHHDALINAPGTVKKDNGLPYTVFTPFYKKAMTLPVTVHKTSSYKNYFNKKIAQQKSKTIFNKILAQKNKNIALHGGTVEAKKIQKNLKNLKDYTEKRDIPELNYTSHLAPHNKFGTVSIREVLYEAIKVFDEGHTFISELYWRDFFSHIGFHFPHVFKGAFHEKYNDVEWENNKIKFIAWRQGKTGFPIVDAGMRELNATGYMHNRARMITASFLVKDLHIDWRWGEKYFAQQLIDYDPAVNNGNWQWAASTGCDAQPYFRIFNPWRQQNRFDAECNYIKRWVPELTDLEPKQIHQLEKQRPLPSIGYPEPIVTHKDAAEKAKTMFALAARK